MKAYIAGKMTGLPDLGYPEFYRVEHILQHYYGWETVNPAALDQIEGVEEFSQDGSALPLFLRRDFIELVHCQGIVLLKNWADSIGANCELALGRSLDMEIWQVAGAHGNIIRPSKAMPNPGILAEYWNQFGALTYMDQKQAVHKAARAAEAE